MKLTYRIIGTLCASAAALSMCSMLSASALDAGTVSVMGDLNNDLTVDAADAQAALQLYVKSVSRLTDGSVTEETETADINMDGVIGLEDAAGILRYYCQTLVGGQPLWADFRTVSYEDGTGFYNRQFMDPETGESTLDENGESIRVKNKRKFALRGMYLEIGCASGEAGETVTVPVYAAGLPKLAGFQLTVSHDEALTPVSITTEIDKQFDWDPENVYNVNPFAENNCGILVAAQAEDISLADGFVIGEFSYTIPEDAEPGAHYCVSVDPTWTMFVSADCCYSNDDGTAAGVYQYTALSGVVTVK